MVGQLLEFCRRRFGADWEQVVQAVDRAGGDDPAQRFASFLQALLDNVQRLVVYLDNLESLLVGPDETEGPADPAAFADWRSPALGTIWQVLAQSARDTDRLYLVASCRYRNPDFKARELMPVAPLPDDALFRLMGWFDEPAAALGPHPGPPGRPPGRPSPRGRVRQRPDRARPGGVGGEERSVVASGRGRRAGMGRAGRAGAAPGRDEAPRRPALRRPLGSRARRPRPADALPHDAAPPPLGPRPGARAGRAG